MKSVGILLAKWTKKLLFTQPDASRLTLQASHFTPHAYEPDRPNKRDKPNQPDRRDMSNVETRPLSSTPFFPFYSLADCSVKPSRPTPSGWLSPEP